MKRLFGKKKVEEKKLYFKGKLNIFKFQVDSTTIENVYDFLKNGSQEVNFEPPEKMDISSNLKKNRNYLGINYKFNDKGFLIIYFLLD